MDGHRYSRLLPVSATSSAYSSLTATTTAIRAFRWNGAKLIPLAVCFAVGLLFRFAVPRPNQVSSQGWQLLAFFVATVLGLIISPLPVSAWAFTCLTFSVITKTMTFAAAMSAFTNEVIWLIITSFFFSRGFMKTGLGDRVAMYFVSWFGKTTLGLSYALVLSEAVISLAMPSATARAGGIYLPIIKSLSASAESLPKDSSARKLGAYLVQSQLQSSSNTSALFFTATAQNLLCINLAEGVGVKIENRWMTWIKISCLPAFISLIATPFILFKIFPPESKETPDAPLIAKNKLEQMGPLTREEWMMVGAMLITVILWIFGESLSVPNVVAAMLGVSILLLLGVLDWDDCLSEKSAWDTLVWFGVLVSMATQLTALGIVPWLSHAVATSLKSLSLSSGASFAILQAIYFFVHYLFASQTAHVGALYAAFLGMHLASQVPSLLAALALAFNTDLFAALTHYGSGQAAVYYGGGYVKLVDFFKLGIVMALVNITIWGLVGAVWWKVLGLY